MARCYLTGVDVDLEDAFVLDLTVAHRTLRELRDRAATLERLITQLGGTDLVPIPNREGGAPWLRKDRRLVSRAMALALAAMAEDRDLFLRWADWRARGRSMRLALLRDDPEYGPGLRALSPAELERAMSLGRQVLDRLARGEHLGHDVRTAVIAGLCVVLRDRTTDDVVAILRNRLASDLPLEDLGVPAGVEPAFRTRLGMRSWEGWGAPPEEPPRAGHDGATDIVPEPQ